MSRWVIAIALGPVSSFIRGGRRSRDLWYGSRFLSEATMIAAKTLMDTHEAIHLIEPLPERLTAINPSTHEGPTITNKILAIIQEMGGRATIDQLITKAESASRAFLSNEIDKLLHDSRLNGLIVKKDLQAQKEAIEQGDFLEFHAAWAPVTGSLTSAITHAHKLLTGKKNARLFPSAYWSRPGVAKSALDSGRDSVLVEADYRLNKEFTRWLEVCQRAAYLRPGERLDAVSLARRRACFRHEGAELPTLQFPPLARVAFEPWLAGARQRRTRAEEKTADALKTIVEELDRLRERTHRDTAERAAFFLITSPVRDPGPRGQRFGYDPEFLMEGGIDARLRESREDMRQRGLVPAIPTADLTDMTVPEHAKDDFKAMTRNARRTLEALRQPVRLLHQRLGSPLPYVAVIEADGDGMGDIVREAVDKQYGPEAKAGDKTAETLMRALYAFADKTWEIIERHCGCVLFAGGDELCAFVPLDVLLPSPSRTSVLRELSTLFEDIVGRECERLGLKPTSLSLGVAVWHLKDDLRHIRRQAGHALNNAKNKRRRDGAKTGFLCIEESPRGGDARHVVGETEALLTRLEQWLHLLKDDTVSMSTAHGLLEHANLLSSDETSKDGVVLARASILQRLERSNKTLSEDAFEELRAHIPSIQTWRDVRHLAHELLLAERVGRTLRQRGEEDTL